MNILTSFFLLLWGYSIFVAGDEDTHDNSGKSFVVAFFQNSATSPQLKVAMVSDNKKSISINVTSSYKSLIKTVTLAPHSTQIVNIDADFQMSDADTVNDKAISIQSNDNFIAYAFNFGPASSDGYLLKPIASLGNYYIIVGPQYDGWGYGDRVQFTITAVDDNTNVVLTDQQGREQTKTLHRFQTWSIRSTANNLSGYTINATKPVAVFSGGDSRVVGPSDCCTDTVGDQLVPVTQWGQSYALMPLLGRNFQSGDSAFDSFFLIVAAFDDTNIKFTGTKGNKTLHLNKNEHEWPFHSSDIGLLTADKPIMVAQMAAAGDFANPAGDGDPFFALLPSSNSFNSKYTLFSCFPSFDVNRHFMQIIAPANETAGVRLDGGAVPKNTGNWVTIPGTPYATITTNLACNGAAKSFSLEHQKPQISIGVLVYGFSSYNSYGYVGGGRLTTSQHFCKPTNDSHPPDNVDNDCDGRVDEELYNNRDDDGDGRVDEDLAASIPELTMPPDFYGQACAPGDPMTTGKPVTDVDPRCTANTTVIHVDNNVNQNNCLYYAERSWSIEDGCGNINHGDHPQKINATKPLDQFNFPDDIVVHSEADAQNLTVTGTVQMLSKSCGYAAPYTSSHSDRRNGNVITRTWSVLQCGQHAPSAVQRITLDIPTTTTLPTTTDPYAYCHQHGTGNYKCQPCANEFYKCFPTGLRATMACNPRTLVYSDKYDACVYPYQVPECTGTITDCNGVPEGQSTTTKRPETQPTVEPADQFCSAHANGNYACRKCGNQFYSCNHGNGKFMNCQSPDLVFNQINGVCVWKWAVDCDYAYPC